MQDWARELAEVRRRMDERIYESQLAAERWRQNAEGAVDESGVAVLDQPLDPADVPADAPRQYREVVERMTSGELAWESVMSGDVDDEGGRAMSMWMDRRLQQMEQVGRLVRRGVPMDDAYAEVVERTGR
jgi:hypothetical protein